VLALLECRDSDDAVRARALELVCARGGFLTIVAIAPKPLPWLNCGPYCTPTVTVEELDQQAETALAHAVSLVPPGIPVVACVEQGRTRDVVGRRVERCDPDVVVLRRRRLQLRAPAPAPVLAC
jgi:hypothetical protein